MTHLNSTHFKNLAPTLLFVLSSCAGTALHPEQKDSTPLTPVVSASLAKQKRGNRAPASVTAAHEAPEEHPQIADELIVQFHPGTTESDKQRAFGKANGKRSEILVRAGNGSTLELIKFNGTTGVPGAIRDVMKDPSVRFAEPNWIVKHTDVSNDTYYTNGSLWGMYGDLSTPLNPFGIHATKAWANSANCGDVVVGIIDEGYMVTHPDLAPNVFKVPGEIAGNGIDDDGNGYIDDTFGWDFSGNNNTIFDGANDDHGTHVAGTIGAVGGNGMGVAGVCWSVKILNAKFLGNRGGTIANAIKAVDYFTDLKIRHQLNLVATNNSWGGGGESKGLSEAIDRANQADILFIAAAGNDSSNNDAVARFPSSYPQSNVISVAALTSTGALASFSNYGATQVDLGAPGSGIWSTVPKSVKGKISGVYASYSGTSMATPHVTGAAALYKSRNPSATAADIKAALLNGIPTESLQGKVLSGNRLNVENF